MPGTLNNLTVGQAYTIIALLADTRGAHPQGSTFYATDGVTASPQQAYAFSTGMNNGTNAIGGYIMGTFTATATTQAFTLLGANQYNAILLENFAPTAPTLGSVTVSGGNLIITGAGGTPGAGYTVLTTTNLSASIVWTTNSTGTLDGTGSLSNSIPISTTTPAQFFRLRLP